MNLMIFPIIATYFVIGWFFSKSDGDPTKDDVDIFMHFLFWPAILTYLIAYFLSHVIFYIAKKILIIIRNIYRLIKKSINKRRRISF